MAICLHIFRYTQLSIRFYWIIFSDTLLELCTRYILACTRNKNKWTTDHKPVFNSQREHIRFLYTIYVMFQLACAAERYIGTFLPLRYQELVTTGRVYVSIAFCVALPAAAFIPAILLGNIYEPGIVCAMYRVSAWSRWCMVTISVLLALFRGIHQSPMDSPHTRLVKRSFDVELPIVWNCRDAHMTSL